MSERRIQDLIDLANRGATAEDASRVLDALEAERKLKKEKEPEERSEASIRLVESVLDRHKDVFKSHRRTEPGGDEDRAGKDIVVALVREKGAPGFHEFSIEVKSSSGGINIFRYNDVDGTIMRVRQGRVVALGAEGAILEYLNERGIIDVDASQEHLEEEILSRFEILRSYWKDKWFAKKKRQKNWERQKRKKVIV